MGICPPKVLKGTGKLRLSYIALLGLHTLDSNVIKNKTKVLECLNFGTYILFPDLQISLELEAARTKNGMKSMFSGWGHCCGVFLPRGCRRTASLSKFMKLIRFTRRSQTIWEVEGATHSNSTI